MRTFPLLLLLATACDLPALCTKGERRCTGDALEECTAHPGGFTGGGIGDIHHTGSSPNTWERLADCGAGLCIATDAGTPFCALEASSNARCTGNAPLACDGQTMLSCLDGHVIERTACGACQYNGGACDPFLDSTCCRGHDDDACRGDSDCAPGSTCVSGRCRTACACAEGAPCPACNPLWDRNAYPSDGAPSQWICTSGLCDLKFQ
jgi:hypothetical protein